MGRYEPLSPRREVVGVVEFVEEYAALRWSVVVGFLVASAIVVARLVAPVGLPIPVGRGGEFGRQFAGGDVGIGPGVAASAGGSKQVVVGTDPGGDDLEPLAMAGAQQQSPDSFGAQTESASEATVCHESDAAHLVMCLVMLAMLVFPASTNPHAVRGLLIAMTVAFGSLLVGRIMEWYSQNRALPIDRMVALGYHLVVAAAMLYAMSGHGAGGHSGPAYGPAWGLSVLFVLDAIAVLVAVGIGRPDQWLGHPLAARTSSPGAMLLVSAVVPHVVMDIGTAYMLIAAVTR